MKTLVTFQPLIPAAHTAPSQSAAPAPPTPLRRLRTPAAAPPYPPLCHRKPPLGCPEACRRRHSSPPQDYRGPTEGHLASGMANDGSGPGSHLMEAEGWVDLSLCTSCSKGLLRCHDLRPTEVKNITGCDRHKSQLHDSILRSAGECCGVGSLSNLEKKVWPKVCIGKPSTR
jgi:hypothetical protein